MAKILSIQDLSCYANTSQKVAMLVLSKMGFDVIPIPTMLFSTHTGFKGFTHLNLIEENKAIVKHLSSCGINYEGVLVGYLGSIEHQLWLNEELDNYQQSLKIFDPAFADNGKVYSFLSIEYIDNIKMLFSKVDVITPNYTEMLFLTRQDYDERFSMEKVEKGIELLKQMGAKKIIITGCIEDQQIYTIVYDKKIEMVKNKYIEQNISGAGDMFSALLMGYLLKGEALYEAARKACNIIAEVILETDGSSIDMVRYLSK